MKTTNHTTKANKVRNRRISPTILQYVKEVLQWKVIKDHHFDKLAELRQSINNALLEHYKVASNFVIKYARLTTGGSMVYGLAIVYWKSETSKYRIMPSVYIIVETSEKEKIDEAADILLSNKDNIVEDIKESYGFGVPVSGYIVKEIRSKILSNQ